MACWSLDRHPEYAQKTKANSIRIIDGARRAGIGRFLAVFCPLVPAAATLALAAVFFFLLSAGDADSPSAFVEAYANAGNASVVFRSLAEARDVRLGMGVADTDQSGGVKAAAVAGAGTGAGPMASFAAGAGPTDSLAAVAGAGSMDSLAAGGEEPVTLDSGAADIGISGAQADNAADTGEPRTAVAADLDGAVDAGDMGVNGGKGLVVLDAGHGGGMPGSVHGSLLEKDIDLKVAELTAARLRAAGIEYAMTRDADEDVPLGDRIAVAAPDAAAFMVSFHCDWFEDPAIEGTSTLFSAMNPRAKESEALASRLQERLANAADGLGTVDRGVGRMDRVYVLRSSGIPAAMVELAFLSNAGDRLRLGDDEFLSLAADRISEGIVEALADAPMLKSN